jgi:hypothetical protein
LDHVYAPKEERDGSREINQYKGGFDSRAPAALPHACRTAGPADKQIRLVRNILPGARVYFHKAGAVQGKNCVE